MPEIKYTCPLCGVTLKAAQAIPPGKKIRCPKKCLAMFAPAGDDEEAEEAAHAPPPKAKARVKAPVKKTEEEEETYKLVHNAEEDSEENKKKRMDAIGPLKDRLPKSARGPALAICQKPSNQMLFTSSAACVNCLLSIVVELWPMIFSDKRLPDSDIAERWIFIGAAVLAFLYNGLIAIGAVKMQNVLSYAWAMIAAALCVISLAQLLGYAAFHWMSRFGDSIGFEPLGLIFCLLLSSWYWYIGVMNIVTLRKAEVVAGFKEKPPADSQ